MLMIRRHLLIVFAFLLAGSAFLATLPAFAQTPPKIVIDRAGETKPFPIAIPNFAGADPNLAQVGADIARVVSADLERSGLFAPIDPRAFIQQNVSVNLPPRFQDWRLINAEAMVAGSIDPDVGGKLKISFRLWDILGEQVMIVGPYNSPGMALSSAPQDWRRAAHQIADAIYKALTGENGYFDSRIVYISETGPKSRRIKKLAVMDQDGENHRFLTQDDRTLVLTPRFSPTNQDITYMSYFNNKPRVYLFSTTTGQQEILGDFPGMTFAPRFSADGQSVVLSMATGGNTDIYRMDIRTRRTQRLTSDPGIDTGGSFSPDGNRIAFESDRGGSQQIYVMNADGSGVQRASRGQGRYGTPVWSPRGDLIAFTRIDKGTFYIGVMKPDGSAERMLATGWLIEGPTWAPNGRVLAYFKQDPSGRAKLHSIDITGRNERELKTPLDGSDPAWSPLLTNQ